MSRKPDDKNDQVRNIINEAVASLVAHGCSNETACGLLIVQGAIRMRDAEELRKLRDFIDGLITDGGDDDDEA